MSRNVQCILCPRMCRMAPGGRGDCRSRINIGGKLYTLVYGDPCAVHIDPIEKKPIFHMLPGTTAFSVAAAGCNVRCKFCQNWAISQVPPEETENMDMPPHKAVSMAVQGGCRSIAYTYSEPVVFYEYMLDTAKQAKEKGIRNIWVTAGYINRKPLEELCPYIDAANIDLKGFTEQYYNSVCGIHLQPVLDAIRITKEKGVWVELTNLLVPTLNDDLGRIKEMCLWIRDTIGRDTPLHFSRFYPMYKLRNLPLTPEKMLVKARETAMETGLQYVYIGNLPGHPGESTYCPKCGNRIISRIGYFVKEINVSQYGKCRFCGNSIPGVWI